VDVAGFCEFRAVRGGAAGREQGEREQLNTSPNKVVHAFLNFSEANQPCMREAKTPRNPFDCVAFRS
jgi:hypothetical protein